MTPSLWRGRNLRTTIGIFALAFLFAFEVLAVATVMPDVARDLHGLRWYAVAFAAPMASSVVAYAVSGRWIDHRGTRTAIVAGVMVFCAGVVVAGLAPTMPVFLAGRLVQGFGAGVCAVAIYVVVAQAYDDVLRPGAFAVLSGAWVLPGLVGPVMAAAVADAVGWRWVFLGVPVIALPAWWLIRDAPSEPTAPRAPAEMAMLGWALLAAAGVLLVSVAGQRDLQLWPVLMAAGCLAVLVSGPRLLPPGTWRGRPGLPSVILTRGLLWGGFATAESYVPLVLHLQRGVSLTLAGGVLTGAAVTWFLGSWAAARLRSWGDVRVFVGVMLAAAGVGGFTSVLLPGVPVVVPMLAWAVGGFGIGLMFATISAITLEMAPPGGEGAASSALQLDDALLIAFLLALSSAVFAGFAGSAPAHGGTLLVGIGAVVSASALLPASRLRAR